MVNWDCWETNTLFSAYLPPSTLGSPGEVEAGLLRQEGVFNVGLLKMNGVASGRERQMGPGMGQGVCWRHEAMAEECGMS